MKELKLNIYWNDVYKMCNELNWFDRATNQEFENFGCRIANFNLLGINFYNINVLARIIKNYSSTDETIEEIRQSLETIIKVRETEV